MNRRNFIKASTFATLTVSATVENLVAQEKSVAPKPQPAPLVGTTPPVLQNVSETGVTVTWGVKGEATGWIEFGETEALGAIAHGEAGGLLPFDARVLRVRLTGLRPGRKYFYRACTAPVDFKGPYDIRRGETVPGTVFSFTTLSAQADSASFTVWNDTHQNNVTLAKLIGHLPNHPADFHVWNGDIFNDIGTEEMLLAEVLQPAGLAYAANRPLMFARGNHDVRGAYARMLDRALEAPEGRYYYSFRHGPVAFLVLDTGEDKDDAHREYGGLNDFASYRTEQQRWLARAIAQPAWQSASFRVLFTHIPLRGREHSVDSRAKWEKLLASARIDFAISGHTHRYAYNEPTPEQPWPLLVGGGPKPEQATFAHVHATAERLRVRAFALEGNELGHWEVSRRS
jgi:acid phosphatase type 7